MNTKRSVSFEPVHAVASLLSGLAVPWWITGGWAIDLAVGRVTRDHSHVNVMMLERDEHALRELTGVDIQLIAGGQPPGPWPAGRRLIAGPVPGPNPPINGPRGRSGDGLILRSNDLPLPAEIILASAVRDIWVYQQGPRIFTRALGDITRYSEGTPFVSPEVVLLIKGRPGTDKPRRDSDQRDFEAALPVLSVEQRSWLKDAIEGRSALRPAIEGQPGQTRRHRWSADLAKRPDGAG